MDVNNYNQQDDTMIIAHFLLISCEEIAKLIHIPAGTLELFLIWTHVL